MLSVTAECGADHKGESLAISKTGSGYTVERPSVECKMLYRTPQEVLDKMTEVAKYLEELGYDDFTDINWISIDYEKIGEYLASDNLVIEANNLLYMFQNYGKGGKVIKTKSSKMPYYVVEETNNKILYDLLK